MKEGEGKEEEEEEDEDDEELLDVRGEERRKRRMNTKEGRTSGDTGKDDRLSAVSRSDRVS